MFEAWSLSLNPIDVGAVSIAALLLVSIVWLALAPRRAPPAAAIAAKGSRQATRAASKAAHSVPLPGGPATAAPQLKDLPLETSCRQQLLTLFSRIEAGIEQVRVAAAIENHAIRKLDAVESEFLSLCDELANVSSFARQRVERPNLGAFAAAAASLGLSTPVTGDARAAAGRPVEPRMDRDPERARRRRRNSLSEAA